MGICTVPCSITEDSWSAVPGRSEMAKQPLRPKNTNMGDTVIPPSQEYTLANNVFGTNGIFLWWTPK